jgi:tetratricopeptide (TPR) repeat protein
MDIGHNSLPHLAFFEALAGMDEGSSEWREATAGLVTLRLVDSWMTEGRGVVAADGWSLRAVRDSIQRVERGSSIRSILTSVVDTMQALRDVRVTTLAPRLMAYARALMYEAQWSLAADVHRTIIGYAHPVDDADVVIDANMQLGACLRTMAQWQEAASAYSVAGQIAMLSGDMVNVLRSRVSEANIAIDRGNLPHAEAILEETISRTGSVPAFAETRALALHARAHVAHLKRDYERAVKLGYEALAGTKTQTSRDRVLVDIATSFHELGVRSAARDAYLILAATAQEQYTRWVAQINLMELAALEGQQTVFEEHRRDLSTVILPANLSAYYFYYVGQGYRLFDRERAAEAALSRAVEIASANQLNQILIQAEAALDEVRTGRHSQAKKSSVLQEPSQEAMTVAAAIREMRELAGV